MDRQEHIFKIICAVAVSKDPCDICTYSGPVYLEAVFSSKFVHALQYGAGAQSMKPLLENLGIRTKDGEFTISLADIWIIAPMPKGGITEEELNAVDLSQGDQPAGDAGKTISEVIRETYRPKSDSEHEYFLRRFLAS